MRRELVVQDCGCIALPEDVAVMLGLGPGTRFSLVVDEEQRALTLAAMGSAKSEMAAKAACPVKS